MTSLRQHPGARRVTVALLASLIAGCAASPAPSAAPPTATETPPSPGSATGSPSASPAAPMPTASLPPRTPAPTRTPAPAAPAPLSCASRVFATMSESQRIGQLFIIGLTRDHHIHESGGERRIGETLCVNAGS